jgi:cell division septal protein FtsQ
MIFKTAALAIFTFVVLVVVLFWLLSFIRQPYRSLTRGKTTAAVGNALQDLDRLLARPSVEHKIEVEQKIHKRDDDVGGQ